MTPAELNETLARTAPAVRALLSPMGERAALPLGIPQQSAQARNCVRKATIGEITDGAGQPLVLPSLSRYFANMEPRIAFRYAPQHGLPELRAAWRAHLDRVGSSVPMSTPIVTCGMSHGLSLCADLFTSPDRPVLIPTPYWDNYDIIFTMRTGAPVQTWPFFEEGRFNLKGLAALLKGLTGPATLLLNFPANPTGYTLCREEVGPLIELLQAHPHPLAVVCDDAYAGLFFEPYVEDKSLYFHLAAVADPKRLLVCKVDGATKELVFFGGRVGFLTFSVSGEAATALEEKTAAILRGTVSSISAPAQAAVLGAIRSPTIIQEHQSVVDELARRYRGLKSALDQAGLRYWPFNSGCFALLRVPEGEDCEGLRQRLIHEQSVGVIAVPQVNGLRVAFCSVEVEDIPDLVARLSVLLH